MRTVPLYPPPPELGNSRRGLITPVRSTSLARSLAAVAALCSGMLALCCVPPVNAQDDSVPAQRTATVVTRNSVTLIWDDPGDESITHYRISRRDLAIHVPPEFVIIDDNTGSATTSYTDDTVEPGGSYLYRITALNRQGASEWSRYARADIPAASTRNAPPPRDGSVPDRPTGLSTIATFNSVTLIWDNPGDSTTTGYVILRRNIVEQDPGVFTTVEANTGTVTTSYTDTDVEAETRYAYWIKAINEHGTSPRSGYVNVETPAVTDSDRASVSEGDTDLPNDNTTPGRVMVASAARSYTPTDGDRGKSVNEAGAGEGSDSVKAGPEEEPVLGDGLPGAPRNLTATPGNKEITLSWEPPADNGNAPATRYRIEWRIDGKDYEKNHWGTARSTTYTTNDQANLANGVKYFFRVKAENDDGNSYGPYGPASEEVSATPTSGSAVDLGTPVLSDTETLHHGMVRLDWQDVEDAGWYVVQHYHLEGGEWLDLPAEGVDIAFHGSSAVVSNLHGLSWLRVGAASCDGASEWSQIEELYGTKESDWEGVPVPEVEEGDQTEPCPVVLGTPVLSDTEYLHHGMVQLDWQDIEDAGWYVVQYYHLEGGEWLDLPAEGVDIAFHGSSAVVSNLHGLSWLRVGAASCDGASEWSQIEELYGTKESDWKGVPVPEVEEGDEIKPCSEDADTSDNSPATGAPTIDGTVQVGETLTANTSGVIDQDGLTSVQYEYQWLADDSDIAGATNATYTLVAEDEGKAIKVQVGFTDDAGNDESLTSEPTAVVAAAPPPPPDNVRAVAKKSGAVELTWDSPQDSTVIGYRIERRPTGGSPSDQERSAGRPRDHHTLVEDTGSTDTGYTDNTAQKGVGYEYRVSARNEAGAGEESDWVNAEEVTAPNSPATGAPTITGTAQVGETLTANTSGIADADGLGSVQYEYQWLADDTDIAGATGSTYTLTDSEESKAITVQVTFADDADNEETLTSVATTAVAGAAPAVSGAPSYITVEVTEDYSDPINIVTNFAITWNDAAVCSVDYNAYLNIKPSTLTGDETEGSQLHLGSAASDGAQITAGLTGVQGGVRGFDVELYCGTDGSGRLVSRVVIPGEYTRPKPGTYSSEPPLSALGVSHGTMTPTFQGGTSRYTVPDVANAETRITITATPKEGNFVKFFEGSGDSPVIGLIVDAWGLGPRPSGLSEDCSRGFGDHYGPLIEMTDADPDTPGFQVDLYDGTSYVWVHAYPTAICTLGKSYALTITRAEGEVSLPRPNRPAIGLPVIAPPGRDPGWQGSHLYIASPCVGCTMNAFVSSIKDRDGWDESTFSYQWLADDADITGATSSSYTAADTDLGKTLKVRVSYTDDRGNEETLTSLATRVVRLRNFMPTGKPVILGTPEVGQTLRVDVSGISDPNGMTNATFTYQWVNTPWTDDEYTLADSDEGRRRWVQAAYTDDAGHMHMLESAPTDAVAARPSSPATGAPTISGTAQVGETLTVDTSGIADENGLENVAFTYQWLADDADIAGATGSTYTLVAEDEGKAITVQVSFTDDAGNDETLTSAATDAVVSAALPPPPDNVRAVTQKSGAVDLTWEAPGDATVTGYRIDRRRAGGDRSDQERSAGRPRDHHALVEDTGSTNTGYTDTGAEKGVGYEYRVSARNEAGAGAGSDWVKAGPPPAPNSPATGLPSISGTAQVGETLTADTSAIADADGRSGATFSYQWVANDGNSDTDITGATDSTYTLAAADEGKTIKVKVSFTDDADNEETLTSAATTAVAGAAPAVSGAPSYITVEVTEDYSDPINIVTNFAITWNDAAVCSVDYNAYLNIKPSTLTGDETEGSQLHLGSAASDGAQITAGLTGVQGGVRGFDVELYCGTDGSGRLVSRVVIPGEYTRPKPGTYSSEPPLSALGVSHGTMTPTFQGGTSRYTVPDVANAETRITITATPKEGNFVKFFEGSGDSPVIGLIVDAWGLGPRPSGLSEDCSRGFGDHYGPLIEMTDADPDTPGFQVDLYDGTSYVWVHAYPTAICTLGKSYALTITRAEGEVSLPRPNRPAIGLPVIAPPGRDPGWQGSHLYIASPCVGCTMNAFVSSIKDRDGWDESTFSYQWLADDADITGATSSSYTAADTDLGKTLKVRVSYTDDRGNEETLTSLATRVVRLRNFMPTGKPVILGTPEVGQTLRVDVSGISDPNGMTNATFTYQWVNTPWTDDEYTLADSDEGRRRWVQAAYTDDAGHMHMLESAPTDAVAARPSSPATGAPTISGTAQVGETLTVDTSGIADENGLENVAFTYQWLADDADIAGATNATYTLTDSEESKAITAQVSFTDDADNEETLTSGATDTVEAAPTTNSPATGAPTISGIAQVGETLTANTSGIADADGLANATFSYQWLADDTDIAGATGLTYTLTDSDESKAIKVQVSFTDDADNEETLTSAATAAVAGAQPTEPPAKPTGLDATASHDSVTLTWDDPGDDSITGYVILRRIPGVDPQGHFNELVANTGTTATTYTDNTVAAETRYTYRIKAINGAGTSERSRWFHINTPAAPVPDKPTGLEATESDGRVVLTWDDPGDDTITGYVILRRVRENDTGGDFSVLVANTGSAATTYTDDTVAAATTYTYRIKAINEHGVSERSSWYHIDIPEAP